MRRALLPALRIRSELPHIIALDARLATEAATNAESRVVESMSGGGGGGNGGGNGGGDGIGEINRVRAEGGTVGQRSSPTGGGGGGDEGESRSSVSARLPNAHEW